MRFEIEPSLSRGANAVRYRVVVTTTSEGRQPRTCANISMTARCDRLTKSLDLTDVSTGLLTIELRRKPYVGGDLNVTIRLDKESLPKTLSVRHVPGQPIEGGCRLQPTLSDLDIWRYLASNPRAVEQTGCNLAAAKQYFHEIGFYEGCVDLFDAINYLASYDDLQYCGEGEHAACEHYVLHGRREGRRVSFDPKAYLARHPDVAQAVQGDEREATLHYLRFGRQEGRQVR